ncbi:coiled-coil domain-containing protein 125-like [Ostrea edulis]|uniref:coiled-coil domain-containing protein 125-like n=1 Tax=Ostrea edulis TaxID=37623 RepID=UPI0024AF7048|nr:coiled-coil domain-containing protein 125-like [Ostrea edulis]
MMSSCKDEDESSLETGDLGLGLGLKPGSLPILNVLRYNDVGSKKDFPSVTDKPLVPPNQNQYSQIEKIRGKNKILKDSVNKGLGAKTEGQIPSSNMNRGRTPSVEEHKTVAEAANINRDDILKKLAEAEQEVEELKTDLEVYEKRLESKYKAIAILRKQIFSREEGMDACERKSRKYEESLEKEVNTLNFELGKRETTFENSQQMWAVRFDSICRENVSLTAELDQKSLELREVKAQKTVLCRERDELLALLDVKERGRYMRSRSVSEDEAYSEYTSTELAVLGACKCRVTSPEPCGCAHAAAALRRELCKLKEQYEAQLRRRDEASQTVDAYRAAFEEQLFKNKQLMLKLAELAVAGPSRYEKAKVILKNLIHLLNDDDYLCEITNQRQNVYSINGNLKSGPKFEQESHSDPVMNDRDLVMALTEILHQRNEAFAHKKLAAQVLSDRVRELENQLSNYQTEDHQEAAHS